VTDRPSAQRRLPDFIIGGAMKAATSSIHRMLAAQPAIFIPNGESFFFDYDDYHQHPYLSSDGRGGWRHLDYETQPSEFMDWYAARFAGAADADLVGEDSASYLASIDAPRRIAGLLPQVRMVFSLRDPVARAYSQYWWMVGRRRIVASFEETLRHAPSTILSRGHYREQVERWLEQLPRGRLHFVLFEDFVANPMNELSKILVFLGRPAVDDVPVSHEKPSAVPVNVAAQLFLNRFLRDVPTLRYAGHLPGGQRPRRSMRLSASRLLNRLMLRTRRPPPMAPHTRSFLRDYYARENAGLGKLVGLRVEEAWRD
jgi:hypothetical protein